MPEQIEILRDMNFKKLNTLINNLSDHQFIVFLQNCGLLDSSMQCSMCGKKNMSIRTSGSRLVWFCEENGCTGRVSPNKGSFFAKSHISHKEILLLSYLWVREWGTISDIVFEMRRPDGTNIGERTIIEYLSSFRDVLIRWHYHQSKVMIGGAGTIVKLELAILSKDNLKKGHTSSPLYVLRGVEWPFQSSTKPPLLFCEILENEPTSSSILSLLQQHLHPGSIILTDGSDVFSLVESLPDGFVLLSPDKNGNIVNPESGEITPVPNIPSLEGSWKNCRTRIRYSSDGEHLLSSFLTYVCDFLWRNHHRGSDSFYHFWKTVRRVYTLT